MTTPDTEGERRRCRNGKMLTMPLNYGIITVEGNVF